MTLSLEDRVTALKNRLHERAEHAGESKISPLLTPRLDQLLKRIQVNSRNADTPELNDAH